MAKSFLSGLNNKEPTGNKLPFKKIALVAGALLVAFGLGLGLFLWQNNASRQNVQTEQKETPVNERMPQGAAEESIAQVRNGDYKGAQEGLEQELKTTDDKASKQKLLIQQAVNAYNQKKYDDSLAYARKAIALDDNYLANVTAAQAAEAADERAAAAAYYRAALAKLSKDNPLYEVEQEQLKDSIRRVSR